MHGGIVRIGNRGLIGANRKLFPAYAYGIFKENKNFSNVMCLLASIAANKFSHDLSPKPSI
jgi:hypothetical protein